MIHRRAAFAAAAALALLFGVVVSVRLARPAPAPGSLLDAVSREAGRAILAAGSAPAAGAVRVCPERAPRRGTIPLARCAPAELSTRDAKRAARPGAAVDAGTTDPAVLYDAGLVEMTRPGPDGRALSRAIPHLQTAAMLSDRPAPVLADLAAAHLLRAGWTQSPRDLAAALEAAERALELERGHAAARIYQALALEWLGLDGEAAREWRRVADAGPTPDWREEARRRLAALARPPAVPPPPGQGAPAGELGAWAARNPQEALAAGWSLLGEWGSAELAGDGAAAAERLRRAEALGAGLVARGGDATLADAVAAIGAGAGDRAATRRLARAHADFAAGRKASGGEAWRRFERAARGAAASPALEGWSRRNAATSLIDSVPEDALGGLRPLVVDSRRYPALAGRTRWSVGTALVRLGRYEAARTAFREAEGLFRRAGETGNVGAMQLMMGDAELRLGDSEAGHALLHRGLATIRDRGSTAWLHELFYITASARAGDGLYRAALRIQDEGVAVAERTDSAHLAEALLARARLRLAAGRGDVEADVERARRIMQRVGKDHERGWLEADLREVEAGLLRGDFPRRAAAALDVSVGRFSDPPIPTRLIPSLLARADARLASGDPSGAEGDLRRAIQVLDGQRDSLSSAALRAGLLETGRRVFDRAAMLALAEGRPAAALAYVERGRVSFAPVRGPGRPSAVLRSPPGATVLEMALIGDTLLAWTVSDTVVRVARTTVSRRELLRTVEEARLALHPRALEALYDRLVRPSAARLGPAGSTLVLIADGELAGVPFAALRDRERGRYLVQDHPLRFAASLGDPVRPASRPAPGTPVLLVADPAFDPAGFPELDRLPGAAAEVGALARQYGGARVLAGAAVRDRALASLLGTAGIVHYAGHAVFDDERPEQSYLVLAPEPRGGASRLTAARIERMELRGVRLVVLSACQTARGQGGRSGGFAGLAGAFMAAGAGGVVGSLWPLDDRATRPLMESFHRAYRDGGDAARALREAQLGMLRSRDPALSAPSAWAGVRYMGA